MLISMGLWKTDLVKLTWYHFYEVTDLADVIKFCRALTGYKILMENVEKPMWLFCTGR